MLMFAWLLSCRGSRVSSRSAAFPCRASRVASRASASSRGIRFTSATTRSSALRRRMSSRSVSKRPLSRSRVERLVGVLAEQLGLLADERLDLLVADLDAELVRRRLEHELAARPSGAPRPRAVRSAAPATGRSSRGTSRAARRATRPAARDRAAARACALRRAGPHASTFEASTSASTRRLRNCASTSSLDLLAQSRLDVGAQLRERLELARGRAQARRRSPEASSP